MNNKLISLENRSDLQLQFSKDTYWTCLITIERIHGQVQSDRDIY